VASKKLTAEELGLYLDQVSRFNERLQSHYRELLAKNPLNVCVYTVLNYKTHKYPEGDIAADLFSSDILELHPGSSEASLDRIARGFAVRYFQALVKFCADKQSVAFVRGLEIPEAVMAEYPTIEGGDSVLIKVRQSYGGI
jgi:hypothetical protein